MYATLPDVLLYFEIFNDLLDFELYPWHELGHDRGKMIKERKTAIRFLKMAIEMHKSENLEENILNVVNQYIPDKHKIPERLRPKYGKRVKRFTNIQDAVDHAVMNKFQSQGFVVTDMVESHKVQNMGVNPKTGNPRRIETTTRAVSWNVPGEDALNPNTWDWRAYATPGELENYEKDRKKAKSLARKQKKELR